MNENVAMVSVNAAFEGQQLMGCRQRVDVGPRQTRNGHPRHTPAEALDEHEADRVVAR